MKQIGKGVIIDHLLYRNQEDISYKDSDLECLLLKRVKENDVAAEQQLLIMHRMYILECARKYHTEHLSIEELITEGSLGLLHAAQKFNFNKNCKFVTYASSWVHNYILTAIYNTDSCIRIPFGKQTLSKQANKIYEYNLSRYDSRSGSVKSLFDCIPRGTKQSDCTVRQLLGNLFKPWSLDTPIDDKTYGYDFISYKKDFRPDDMLIKEDSMRLLKHIMHTELSERERDVVSLYYGISGTHQYTFAEIGVIFDLSKERIRQILHRAIKKLKQVFEQIEGFEF